MCPQDSTKRSRAVQRGEVGSCRSSRLKIVNAAGARLMAVPGWPEPAASTESMARVRQMSTVRRSRSVQSRGAVVVASVIRLSALPAGFRRAGEGARGRSCSPEGTLVGAPLPLTTGETRRTPEKPGSAGPRAAASVESGT